MCTYMSRVCTNKCTFRPFGKIPHGQIIFRCTAKQQLVECWLKEEGTQYSTQRVYCKFWILILHTHTHIYILHTTYVIYPIKCILRTLFDSMCLFFPFCKIKSEHPAVHNRVAVSFSPWPFRSTCAAVCVCA